MENIINITKETENKFSSFKFYNRFLNDVAKYYRSESFKKTKGLPEFSFFESSLIDPMTLPLIITLGEYLKQFHNENSADNLRITLHLDNDLHRNNVLKFLHYSDFFKIAGNNDIISRNIFAFDERMVGAFTNDKIQNPDHKVRGYSLKDDDLWIKLISVEGLEEKRDFLLQYFASIVNDHFCDLLNSSDAITYKNEFIDILSELITNGLIHSGSDAYVLMFTNRYKTTFSVSDLGKGLYQSISEKNSTKFYVPFEMIRKLSEQISFQMDDNIKNSAFSIFETLYYSTLKDRKGLIDLIINVVNRYNGTFRIHNVSVQIIISSRMSNEIEPIIQHRHEILDLWNKKKFNVITIDEFEKAMAAKQIILLQLFLNMAKNIFNRYSEDIQFAALRIYNVQFNGVHIEAEIPQKNKV